MYGGTISPRNGNVVILYISDNISLGKIRRENNFITERKPNLSKVLTEKITIGKIALEIRL